MVIMKIKLIGGRGLHSNSSFEHHLWALSKKEIDDIVPRSNIWWRGRSYGASVASDVPELLKDRKRVPKEARRALIESFVDKYKAKNGGKFPSVSYTKKEVGGSFYVVRNILQELQNKSALSNIENIDDAEIPSVGSKHLEAASDCKMSSSYAEKTLFADDKFASLVSVSHSTVPVRGNLLKNDSEETSSTSHKETDNDGKEVVDSFDYVRTESHMLKYKQGVSNSHLETKSSSEEVTYGGSNCKEEQVHHSLELNRQKINNRTTDVAELPSKSKPWRLIKSFVDGIINIWRTR